MDWRRRKTVNSRRDAAGIRIIISDHVDLDRFDEEELPCLSFCEITRDARTGKERKRKQLLDEQNQQGETKLTVEDQLCSTSSL